jgi:hypothetical protein
VPPTKARIAVSLVCSALTIATATGTARGVVICQKKNKVSLRATACRTKETALGEVATKDQLPVIPPDLGKLKYVSYHMATTEQVDNSPVRANFDAVDVDPNGSVQTGPNWTFTAPEAGVYLVNARLPLITLGIGVTGVMTLIVDNVGIRQVDASNFGAFLLFSLAEVVTLAQGDVVWTELYSSASSETCSIARSCTAQEASITIAKLGS